MIILGIDPGTISIGYAIVALRDHQPRILAADLIKIRSPSGSKRLEELARDLGRLIDIWHPSVLAIERLFFSKNQKTALAVAEARGAILLTASIAGLMVYEYTPLEIKKTVTGDGNADKRQLEKMIRLSFPEAAALKAKDDVFDAIAAAFTCYLKDVRGFPPSA